MTFRLIYEITHDQQDVAQCGRMVRVEAEIEPASSQEVMDAVNAWLTAVSGEREGLRRDTMAQEEE